MATWVEDIVQALKNLGGQAHRKQIFAEITRIRKGPLPASLEETVQRVIQDHSSDSNGFRGDDLFKKIGNGVWALRDQSQIIQPSSHIKKQSEFIPSNYLPPESLDDIANLLQTIKQYRDFQHPDSSSWKEYIDEFFHILGFSIDKKNPRLMTLNEMDSSHTPKAIVGFVHPGEDFEEILPGLSWESYLFLAANYYQINWGIITDGLQLKIIHFINGETKQLFNWADFDCIIQNEKIDTFCSVYKIFSFIKGNGTNITYEESQLQSLINFRL